MSKEYNTKPVPSNCKEEDTPVVECGIIIVRNFCKISPKILIVLFVFCLGFILSELSYSVRYQKTDDRIEDFDQFVYLYDTEQKLEDYYKMMERVRLDKRGLHPKSFEGSLEIKILRLDRPLARIGPFVVFANNDTSRFTVREQSSDSTLVALTIYEQSKYLSLYSSLEQGWSFPRFNASLTYSEDGVYKSGSLSAWRGEREVARTYDDTKGIGVFDIMRFFENNELVRYRLNELTWERVDEPLESLPFEIQLHPLIGSPDESLDGQFGSLPLFGDEDRIDNGTSNENNDVNVEQQ